MTDKTKRATIPAKPENKANPAVAKEAIMQAEALNIKSAPEELVEDRYRNSQQDLLKGLVRDIRPVTYEHESPLSLPEDLKDRMDSEGYELRWLRYSLQGKPDVDSIRRRRSEGFEFITAKEVPEIADFYSGIDGSGSEDDLILRNDVALAKITIVKARQIRERKRLRAQSDMQHIASAHASKGILNSSQGVAARGTKRPGFSENNES